MIPVLPEVEKTLNAWKKKKKIKEKEEEKEEKKKKGKKMKPCFLTILRDLFYYHSCINDNSIFFSKENRV